MNITIHPDKSYPEHTQLMDSTSILQDYGGEGGDLIGRGSGYGEGCGSNWCLINELIPVIPGETQQFRSGRFRSYSHYRDTELNEYSE